MHTKTRTFAPQLSTFPFCTRLAASMLLCVMLPMIASAADGDDPELFRSKNVIMLMEVPQRSGDYKSDAFWKGIPAAVMFNEASLYAWPKNPRWNESRDLKAEFALAHDTKKLYLRAKVTDDTFVKREDDKPESDQIELYIAAEDSPTQQWGVEAFQLRIVPGRDGVYTTFEHLNALPGSSCETRFEDDGYTVHAAIPWASLMFEPPVPGATLPCDFRVLDADEPNEFKSSMVWNNFPEKTKLWKIPAMGWGQITFVKELSEPYLAGERVIVKGAAASGPLRKDDHTLLLADFDAGVDAVYAKGDPAAATEKLKITSGGKGRYGEALRPVDQFHPSRACSYALQDNFSADEGTIELEFNSLRDGEESKFPYFLAIRAHPMGGSQQNAFAVSFDQRSSMIRFSVSPPSGGKGGSVSIPFRLVKDRWNKLAVTWKNFNTGKPDASMEIHVNGKSQQIDNVRVDFQPPAAARLLIGSSSNEVLEKAIQPGFMVIDELRISDIARSFAAGAQTAYEPKRTEDGKLIETRYLGTPFPLEKEKIDHIIQLAFNANYNVVMPKVEPGLYKSDLSSLRDSVAALDYDPLQYFIEQAHEHNMELVPFINVVRSNQGLWLGVGFDGKCFESADMSDPNAKTFIVQELSELAENYDVDGICLDFIRYSKFNFSKREAQLMKEKFGIDIHSFGKDPASSTDPERLKWFKWREENISEIVERTHRALEEIDPDLFFSTLVWNNRVPRIAQHWETWVDNGWVDRIIVMNYSRSLGEVKACIMLAQMQSSKPEIIDTVLQAWKGRWSDPGGLGKMTPADMSAQIEGVREYGVTGTGHWRSDWNTPENFIALSETAYKGKAVPAYRSQPRKKRQRPQTARKLNIEDFCLESSIAADGLVTLPRKSALGGIFLDGDASVSVEYRDDSGDWLPLTHGKPAGDFTLPGYMAFPPVVTDALKVTPATGVVGVTRPYGISANALDLRRADCTVVTPEPGAAAGPAFAIAADGTTTIDAVKGDVSGTVERQSVGPRDFVVNRTRAKGALQFNLEVDTAGTYELWMLVNGPAHGSCHLSIDFGSRSVGNWQVLTHGPYEWRCSSSDGNYLLYQLEPGQYALKIGWPQAGVKIAKIALRRQR